MRVDINLLPNTEKTNFQKKREKVIGYIDEMLLMAPIWITLSQDTECLYLRVRKILADRMNIVKS